MNFNDRSFDQQLLQDMYNVPSKELPVEQIATILSTITGKALDTIMVSKLFNRAGLDLRKRNRVAPKVEVKKEKRITKQDVLNELFGTLGIASTPETPMPDVNETVVYEIPDVNENEVTPDVDETGTGYVSKVLYEAPWQNTNGNY